LLVPIVELAVALVALLPLPSGLLVIPAAAFVILVSVPLSTGDVRAGCGCWRAIAGGTSRGIYLARNGLLLVLAAAALAGPQANLAVSALAILPAACAFAVLIMEIPEVASVLAIMNGRP